MTDSRYMPWLGRNPGGGDRVIFANQLLANLTFADWPFPNQTFANLAISQPYLLPTRLVANRDFPNQAGY